MPNNSDDIVTAVVLEVLRDVVDPSEREVLLTDRLVKDLRIDSDDLSFLFVPNIQDRLGLKIPVKEWRTVYTIQDTINLCRKYFITQQIKGDS